MDTCKLMLLLLGLCGYCCAGPVGTKRNMPIKQRDDLPMISQTAGSEEDQPEDQRVPPELMSTLTLPSNATSIRADITDNFSCENKMYGYYADVENECQIFHVCLPVTYADGKENTFRWSFICPEETIFSQESFTCMRPDDMNFDCKESLKYYELNSNFGAVEEDTSTNSNNNNNNINSNNVMPASNEEEQETAMIMQPEAQQPAIEEPMEPMVVAPPKPTLTQPMKDMKKPVKVQIPNRRKPPQTQMGIMKKPAMTLPLRKLPQVVPNIEPAAAVAIETKPAEEEEKPIYQKYHKRPTTVQATSSKDKLQAQKPVKNTPIRAELYNQVRRRPTYSNKKDTPIMEAQEETAEMLQPELSEPEPTLKLETIFMPAQKPAETSADNSAQASVAEAVYVKPEKDIDSDASQADISTKAVAIADTHEEKEALTPEATKTSVGNLATVEGVLKTEEPDSIEENITSVESLKSSVLTAEPSNVEETAVVSENIMEPDIKFSETVPVVELVTSNGPNKLEVTVPEVQEAEEDKLVLTNEVKKVGEEENAKATDEIENSAAIFTVTKEDELEEAEKPVVKDYLPNKAETSVPEEVESVSSKQAEKTEMKLEEEEKEVVKPVVKITLANQVEETKEATETTTSEEAEDTAVKLLAANQVEKTKTEPETAESSNPTKTESQPEISAPENEETPAVKFVSSNPTEQIETQPETAGTEEQETSAVKFVPSNPIQKTEEIEATQNTQETEPVVPELSPFMQEAPTYSGDNSQQIIEAIEEIPAVIVELEQHKPVMAEEQDAVDEMNVSKTLEEENFNQDSAEAFAQPNEPSPVDFPTILEEMEEAKPNNAIERLEATPAMQEHDPIVQTMFANTLKQSSGGFKPVDPAMAAEAEALITDFLSTLMKSESSNNKPIYPGVAQADSGIIETKAEENKMESEPTVEEEKRTENEAKVETAPEVDEAVSQRLKNDAQLTSMLMFNQLPESMYQIPVQVVNLPQEAEKATPEIVEKHDETHTNLDALHVKNAHEEASQNEVEQAQTEHLEEEKLASNATPDMQQLKTVVDSTDSYTPLSIDDIVELVKERLEQKPAATQVNWAESSELQDAAETNENEQIVEKHDELKPNEQQLNEEIIMPIYQRVIDGDPNMLKSHHHLLVNEPTAIMTESKPITTEVTPEESNGEVEVVDIKKALETPAASIEVASDPTTVVTQQATAPETPEVPVPKLEFVVDPKTGRFYRSRSLKNTKMDPRKRRFLFRSDAS